MTDDPTPLNFQEFNRRLTAIPDYEESSARSLYRSKLGFVMTLLAFALSLLITRLSLPPMAMLVSLSIVLVMEIAGVALSTWYSMGDYSSMRHPLQTFAKRLDHDLPYYAEMIDWLASWPKETLLKHADMARFRRERMALRMPMLLGSMDKLGILPVMIAIYFQFREYQAGRHISVLEGVFAFVVAFMYYLTWTTALTKSRLDEMDMYMREAMSVQDKQDATDTVQESTT